MDQIRVKSLVPNFITFYEKASVRGLGVEEIWALWNEHYHFAAVPPGEEGREIARKLLFSAWDKYHQHIDRIKCWEPDTELISSILVDVKKLLGYEKDIKMTIVFFVGAFEANPFVAPILENEMGIFLPIETETSSIFISHELTHIVHGNTANLEMQWERPIAHVVIQEGLAMHVSKILNPGFSNEEYTEHRPGWLKDCEKNRETILRGIYPSLSHSSSEHVFQFTMGTGASGFEREAYYAGWDLVQHLLNYGLSLADLAHLKGDVIPSFVKEQFEKIYNL